MKEQDLKSGRVRNRPPFRIGLFDLEFLRGDGRRSPQPAEGGKAKKTGDRREQNTAVNHHGLRAKRNTNCSLSNTGRGSRRYTHLERFFSPSFQGRPIYPPLPSPR